ncbi:hypothetical protein PCANC_20972 [Puccinia coronata f. sp. avenae]|uniref:Uncharacterized protein n=1 Tax=Puccinia coronata f. sp. avenae TaxID=200324 RepID=A0A2N5UBL6_9BASI|nr:hypothetical protein PCASD_25406 [Puccinia coronata f. sp. avenae]PLW35135.1 hypothetical protein PCANC_20972 [Puccinia coronata f. sp. avenae]PLW35856.1 hypothetical protein PCASD_14455 [Puccinia coronata f. sp. avenae]
MRFYSFIALVALLLIQSEVTHCAFVCNDNTQFPYGKKVIGVCARGVQLSEDNLINQKYPIVGWRSLLDEEKYKIFYPAAVDPLGHFSCKNVKVATKDATFRYCSTFVFDPIKPLPRVFSLPEIQNHCYSRDGRPTPHKPPPNDD